MNRTQVDELLAAVAALARRYKLDEWDLTRAQSIAWLLAVRCDQPQRFPWNYWAVLAIRRVRCGRDLPGCETGENDVLRRTWLSGPMNEVRDPGPGPAAQAAHREAWELLENDMTEMESRVAALALDGLSGVQIAERLGRTQGRVSQLRRQVVERWAG
jgi:DNA-binding CsgD family transcriptional regulator